jgi:lysophospholipase L1-like esterase
MKKTLANVVLGGAALLIALACGEVVARIYLGYQNKAMRERNQGNILTRPPFFEELFAPIEPGGFTNRSHFAADWWGITIRTDSLGCRIGPSAPASAHRILFIGDSMIFGTGLTDSMTIPALVQKNINEQFPQKPALVINAGVPGYDFRQYIYLTQRLGAALHPDLVLIGICNNDVFPTEDPFGTIFASRGGKRIETPEGLQKNRGGLPRKLAAARRELMKSSALYTLWQQVKSSLKMMMTNRQKYDPLLSESGKGAAETTDDFLKALSDLGIPYGFIYQPGHANLGKESDYIFYQLLKARRQPALDLCLTPGLDESGYFAKEAAGGMIQPQMHFNTQGSQIVARAITDWVVEEGLWK